MTARVYSGDTIVDPGDAITVADNDTIFISAGATVAAPNGTGLTGETSVTGLSVVIDGVLAGSAYGMDFLGWSNPVAVVVTSSGGLFASSFAFYGGLAGDIVVNRGFIAGDVYLGAGSDVYDGRGGRTSGTVNGSAGDDALLGGVGADTFFDLLGANWIVAGNGDDRVTVGIGHDGLVDMVFGGEVDGTDNSANDTIVVSGAASNVFLTNYAINAATGQIEAWLAGFENAIGGSGDDSLIGTGGANVLDGDEGRDWLVGGGGADRFSFSQPAHAIGDIVADFRRSDGDRIDLASIDANLDLPGDQAFVVVEGNAAVASPNTGEVWVWNFGSGARVDVFAGQDQSGFFYVSYADGAMSDLRASDFIL